MVKVSKKNALKVKSQYLAEDVTEQELASAFYKQIEDFYSISRVYPDYEVEKLLLKQKALEVEQLQNGLAYSKLPKFSPSGAGKCDLELYKLSKGIAIPELELQPYHRRWTKNGTAAHEAIQRDLLYMEVNLDNPRFTVLRNEQGLPMWESNLKARKEFTHNGQTFLLSGMCDGLLKDEVTGDTVIFEYKTKSTTIAAVGNYLMKDAMPSHIQQGVYYSIMFCGDPYEDRIDTELFLYESLAKDGWAKGTEAKQDIRVFQHSITLQDRMAVLNRLSNIVALKEEPSHDDCDNFFCPLKD